jgi:hypothetical protein
VKSLTGKYDESIASLTKAIEWGYGESDPRMLEAGALRAVRRAKQDEFEKLRTLIESNRSSNS